MCGLVFLFDQTLSSNELSSRTRRALDRIQHRGPDEGQSHFLGQAALGHRRLSIIGIVDSKQPMSDPTGQYHIVYNGEIYNFCEKREQLASRWDFRTSGDTEVLLAGLILEGERFLESLEGMWAYVIWDSKSHCLKLGRDRMGKKPLYYQELPQGGIACSSELSALRELSDTSWQEDEDSTADYLRYGYAMPGYTAFREVREIMPGHVGSWEQVSGLVQRSWWKLKIRNFAGSQNEAARKIRETLIESVEKRMVADVEVGAFLSGGIDSSLICSIIRKELNTSLKTFTIGFEEAAFDERRYARLVADIYKTEHFEGVLSEWKESQLEQILLNHVSQPFADPSILPTALVSEVAAGHVKVALSGDGGDELFSGYQRYQARSILIWYSRLPKGLRNLAEKAIRSLPEPTVHHSRSTLKKAHLFMDIVSRQQAETPYFAPTIFNNLMLPNLAPSLVGKGHSPPGIPEQTELDDVGRMMFADTLIYLPQDILTKVDRASMAYSLETRAPFLDRSVIELAFSLPVSWHRKRNSGKRMLKEAFKDHLPASIWKRRKQGFGVPIHSWFKSELGERLSGLANQTSQDVICHRAVDNLLAEHREGVRDHSYRLWTLFSYLLWKSRATCDRNSFS